MPSLQLCRCQSWWTQIPVYGAEFLTDLIYGSYIIQASTQTPKLKRTAQKNMKSKTLRSWNSKSNPLKPSILDLTSNRRVFSFKCTKQSQDVPMTGMEDEDLSPRQMMSDRPQQRWNVPRPAVKTLRGSVAICWRSSGFCCGTVKRRTKWRKKQPNIRRCNLWYNYIYNCHMYIYIYTSMYLPYTSI